MQNEIGLYWKGPWEIRSGKVPYEITDEEGVYIILTGRKEKLLRRWKIFDQIISIGYSPNIRKGLRDSGKWEIWENHNQTNLLVKVATFTKKTDSKALIFCLHHNISTLTGEKPKGTEPDTGVETLIIRNKGQKWPLADSYQCRLPIIQPVENKTETCEPPEQNAQGNFS